MKQLINRYLLTLVTMLTLTTGAWADELTVYDGETTSSYVPLYGFYADAYLKCEFVMPASELTEMAGQEITSMTFYSLVNSVNWGSANFQVFLKEVGSTTISAFTGTTGATIVYEGSLSISDGKLNVDFTTPYDYEGGNLLIGVYNTQEGSYVSSTFYGTTVTDACVQGYSYSDLSDVSPTQRNFIPKTTFTYGGGNHVEVIINEDKTEASFDMPASDVTVKYSILRDLSYEMTLDLFVNDKEVTEEGVRIIVAKYSDGYHAYDDMDIVLNDNLEDISLTSDEVLNAKMMPQYYLQQEDGSWEPVGMNRQNGLPVDLVFDKPYCMSLVAYGDSNYGGETEMSAPFIFTEAYWVYVPAGEYITYYQEKALYTENENIKLYTVSSIEGDEALLSDPIDIVPAETPMLIFNSGDDDDWYLVISTEDDPDDIEAVSEFKGTLDKLEMPGSTEDTKYYICNGHDFVYVKSDGTIAANRCWIEIGDGAQFTARQLKITFPGNTTGLSEELIVNSDEFATATWYTLEGRKLDKMPTKKGVYIQNGKKVVIK